MFRKIQSSNLKSILSRFKLIVSLLQRCPLFYIPHGFLWHTSTVWMFQCTLTFNSICKSNVHEYIFVWIFNNNCAIKKVKPINFLLSGVVLNFSKNQKASTPYIFQYVKSFNSQNCTANDVYCIDRLHKQYEIVFGGLYRIRSIFSKSDELLAHIVF